MRSGSRILIRGTNWIGDSVMSLAAMREVRRLFPEARLSLLVKPWVAGLFEGQGIADDILSYGDLSVLEQARLIRRRTFDLGILFTNSFSTAAISLLGRVPQRVGYGTDLRGPLLSKTASPRVKDSHHHQVYYYLDLLSQTGLSDRNYVEDSAFRPDVRLQVTPEARREADRHLDGKRRPYVVLNPGAFYGSAKRWFPERYARVADRLQKEADVTVILVGSKAERSLADLVAREMKHQPLILTGETSLASLMGILAASDLFITNDSGPMHLAAALEAPQIAIFGSTDEIATGPLSEKATVIHKHVACNPCLLRECPIDLRCFDRISVEEVTQTALSILSATKQAPPASHPETP